MQNSHDPKLMNPTHIDDSSLNGSGETLRDRIQRRAYQLYMERGREDGHAAEDWARAEREVMSNSGQTTG